MRLLLSLALFWSFWGFSLALSASGSRLLVVADDIAEKDKYSIFWNDLQQRGFAISYTTPKNDPELIKHGERAYDHLLLLPSNLKALGSALTPNILLDFLKLDGNILLTLSGEARTPTSINSLLLELDITVPSDRNAIVLDHFNYDTVSSAEKHDVLLLDHPNPLREDVKNYFGGAGIVAFPRAIGQALGNASPLLAPIVRAPSTAYSANPKESDESDTDFPTGKQISIVSALQARNSARLTILGSGEMLENTWFNANVQLPGGKKVKTGNREFAAKLSAWAFKEVGVLKVGQVKHHLREDSGPNNDSAGVRDPNPKLYRIKNDVTYSIELSEYSQDQLAPFNPPNNDAVQLEFTMLSPYHRLPLKVASRTANSTIFTTSFRLPDQHGIFNFRVNYKRPFLTPVDEKHTVTVRHFAHDEWPRSYAITGAWLWLAGIWLTVLTWIFFVGLWLYGDELEVDPNEDVESKKIK